MKMKLFTILLSFITILFSYHGFAFVRLDDTDNGVILGGYWVDSSIDVYIDKDGDLKYTQESPIELAEVAFLEWNNIKTSNLRFNVMGYMSRSEKDNKKSAGQYVTFMYINDDDVICKELKIDCGSILGFATSSVAEGSTNGEFVNSAIIINGNHSQMNSNQFLVTVTHEFGHFAGLDHSPIYGLTDLSNAYLPTLFAVSVNEDEQLTLAEDDRAGISTIYPNSNYFGEYGAIKGKVTDYFGNPVFGAHVIAFDAITNMPIISAMTGSPNCYTNDYKVTTPGEYVIPWMPAGDYKIGIESFPIYGGEQGESNFVSVDEIRTKEPGSGVGIFDFGNFDYGFPQEFYGSDSSTSKVILNQKNYGIEDISLAGKISVTAGNVVTNVDFVTGIDETRDESIFVGVVHPKKSELTITIGADGSSSCKETFNIDDDGSNVFSEFKISDIGSNCTSFLPPSTSNKWYLTVKDSTTYGSNTGEIIAFKIYYNGETYISSTVSTQSPHKMLNTETKTVYIEGTKETSSYDHSDIIVASYCGESPGDKIQTPGGSTSDGSSSGSGSSGTGTGSDVDEALSGDCACVMSTYNKPINERVIFGDLILLSLIIFVFTVLRKSAKG